MTSATSRRAMNNSNLGPSAALMPEPPGPPARYTMGEPGFGLVDGKRTKCKVNVAPSGSACCCGTSNLPRSASTTVPSSALTSYGAILMPEIAGDISEERRVGEGWVVTCNTGCAACQYQEKIQ